ncbi:MAG: TlpA disulfide reductase family protein, partial [Acidobacteriota bacterium]|nr:TlpA disulfide reductase family protein [Acidobacteriota bacterium]
MSTPHPRASLAVLIVAAVAGSAVAADPDTALVWVGDDGRPAWSVPFEGPTPSATADLIAEPWFPSLADVRVPLLEGGEFSLASARGNVLLIDFWASWCTPCLAELPQLQKLYEAEKDRGLMAIAINSQESVTTIRAAVEAMKLSLPIGKYDSAVDRAFAVR